MFKFRANLAEIVVNHKLVAHKIPTFIKGIAFAGQFVLEDHLNIFRVIPHDDNVKLFANLVIR